MAEIYENDIDRLSYNIADFGIGFELPLGTDMISSDTISGASKPYVAPELECICDENNTKVFDYRLKMRILLFLLSSK